MRAVLKFAFLPYGIVKAAFGVAARNGIDATREFSASIAGTGIWCEVLQFIGLPLPFLGISRWRFFSRNVWPNFRVPRIERQPFLKPCVRVGFYRVYRAFRHANAAVNAFVRVDHEHVLALVETIHGAHLDAVHDFAANAAVIDDVGQSCVLSADCSGELSSQRPLFG